MNYDWDWEYAWRILPDLLGGLWVTVQATFFGIILAMVLGLFFAILRRSDIRAISWPTAAVVEFIRSTPLLVQLFLIYYGSGQFRPFLQDLGVWFLFRDAWFCAILALTLNTGAYTSEIIRGGIESVPHGQIEAGRAVGMSRTQLFRRITFPVAMRQALPAYGNEVILMVKASSLASTITILEITGIAKTIIAQTFRPVEVFVVAGALYLCINFVASQAIAYAERRLSPASTADRAKAAERRQKAMLAR